MSIQIDNIVARRINGREVRHLVAVADIEPLRVEEFAVSNIAEDGSVLGTPEQGRRQCRPEFHPIGLDVFSDRLPVNHCLSFMINTAGQRLGKSRCEDIIINRFRQGGLTEFQSKPMGLGRFACFRSRPILDAFVVAKRGPDGHPHGDYALPAIQLK